MHRKHGHFRPNLLKLVKSNTEKEIEDITAFAYQELQNPVADNYMGGNTAIDSVTVTLHILQKLKGIGTATGSLILSVWTPMPYESIEDDCMDEYEREISGVPFFSDELFRWCMWDAGSKGKELGGWQRKIRYTGKEWKDMREQVWKLGKRLGVKAVECEKVAYVLGRERVDVGMEFREGQGEDLSIDPKRSTSTDTKKQSVTEDETRAGATGNKIPKTDSKAGVSLKKVGKRKITDTISPPEVVRKSSRRKTSN
jgi:hypothetical protein